jgi:hypothetical protein
VLGVCDVALRQLAVVLCLAPVDRCCGVLPDRLVEQCCGFVRGRRAATRATEIVMRPRKPLLGKEPALLCLRNEHGVRCEFCRFDDPDARTPRRLARRRSPRTSRGAAVARVVRASVEFGDTGVCTRRPGSKTPLVFIPKEETGSSPAPMLPADGRRSVGDMKRRLFFLLVVTGLLVLAIGGWTVQGLRWAATGGWSRGVPQPA